MAVAALASFAWGFGGIFAVLISASGLVLTFYRLWLGSALLLVILYATGRRMSWSLLRATWLGGVFLAGDMTFFFSALKLASVVDVSVIGAVQPVLVLMAARRLFGERMGRWDVMWMLVAVAGVTLTVLGPGATSHHQLAGDLLAVGALLSWSAYWLASKKARVETDALEYTTGVTIVSALIVTPIVFLAGQSLGHIHAGDWFWLILLAVVPGSGHLLMNWAHKYVDASVSSVISCLSPLIAAVAAVIFLHQPLSTEQVGGLLVGLVAISIVAARHNDVAAPALE